MVIISPSILAAKKDKLNAEVERALHGGAKWIHIDVMDESDFVPEATLFKDKKYTRQLRERFQTTYLDVHLMVRDPLSLIEDFTDVGASLITFHLEANPDASYIQRTIQAIKSHRIDAGLVLNPDTPIETVYPYLSSIDVVLLMSVHPGRCGQGYIPEITDKIKALRSEIDKNSLTEKVLIEIDGGIKADNAYIPINAGADVLVSGSGIFGQMNYREVIEKMKEVILIGSDHGGYKLKQTVMAYLNENGYAYKDVGCYSEESCDHPDYARIVRNKVNAGECKRGILICGTGIGMSIVANKFPNVNATVCHNAFTAQMAREHNDSNVLCLGERVTDETTALEIVDIWLNTEMNQGEKYVRRVRKYRD